MDNIIRILVDRLVRKGVELGTIPAYIRDLANTISNDTDLSLQDLNRRMQLLGWDDLELDDHTLQLITAIFETDGRHSWDLGKAVRSETTFDPGKKIKMCNPNSQSREENYESKIQSSS